MGRRPNEEFDFVWREDPSRGNSDRMKIGYTASDTTGMHPDGNV